MIVLGIYFGLGLAFAVVFLARGVRRFDPAAEASTLGFRLILLPGLAALWPYLLVRWLR